MTRDKLLDTLVSWGPLFRLYLEFKLTSFNSNWVNFLSFVFNDQLTGLEWGPRLSLNGDTLSIGNPVNGKQFYSFKYTIEENKWYQLEIIQNYVNDKVSLFSVFWDSKAS